MLPDDRAQPAAPDKPALGTRLWRAYRQLPIWLQVIVAIVAIPFFEVFLVYAVVAVTQGRRTVGASLSVALWGVTVYLFAYKNDYPWIYSVILLPFAVVLAAHAKLLARSFVPCRTVAWVLAWSVPAGVLALKTASGQPFLGTITAWLLAAAVLGWRVAKGIQDTRMYGGRTPSGLDRSAEQPSAGPAGTASPAARGGRPAGHPGAPAPIMRAQAAALPYAEHAARDHPAGPP